MSGFFSFRTCYNAQITGIPGPHSRVIFSHTTMIDTITDDVEKQRWEKQLALLDADEQIVALRKQTCGRTKPPVQIKHVNTKTGRLVKDGVLSPGRFALTFDDGPSLIATELIMQILDEFGVCCNFFHIGDKAKNNPSMCKAVAEAGHIVGSHSMTHADLVTLPGDQAQAEILNGAAAVADASGCATSFFRFPYGRMNSNLLDFVKISNIAAFGSHLSTKDWNFEQAYGGSLTAMFKKITSTMDDIGGGIIVMHDLVATALILPDILRHAIAREYTIVQFRPAGQQPTFQPMSRRFP